MHIHIMAGINIFRGGVGGGGGGRSGPPGSAHVVACS